MSKPISIRNLYYVRFAVPGKRKPALVVARSFGEAAVKATKLCSKDECANEVQSIELYNVIVD